MTLHSLTHAAGCSMAKSNTDQFLDHDQSYATCEAVHRPSHPGATGSIG